MRRAMAEDGAASAPRALRQTFEARGGAPPPAVVADRVRRTAPAGERGDWQRIPLLAFLAYIAGTFSLCFIGLFSSPGFAPWRVGGFVALALALFAAGYLSVCRASGWGPVALSQPPARPIAKLVLLGVGVRLTLVLLGLVKGLSTGLLSLQSVLTNPGDVYRFAHSDLFDPEAFSLLTKLEVLSSPLWYLTLPLALFYFRYWTPGQRLVVTATVLLNVLKPFLMRGVQKPIGDLAIIFGAMLILQAALAGWRLRRIAAYGGCLSLLFLAFMAFNQGSRLVAYNAVGYDGGAMFEVNRQHPLFKVFGDRIGESVAVTLSYANIGYFGLSYCFDLPFQWTYGIGNSFALMSYAEQYFDLPGIIYDTYPLRGEAATGWPSMMYWETIIPWLASDLTYPGVLIFCVFLGRFCATVWRECLCFRNPLSIAVLGYLTILLLFFPCNNQLLQTRESTIGCLGVLAVWLVGRRSFNRRRTAATVGFSGGLSTPRPALALHASGAAANAVLAGPSSSVASGPTAGRGSARIGADIGRRDGAGRIARRSARDRQTADRRTSDRRKAAGTRAGGLAVDGSATGARLAHPQRLRDRQTGDAT